ncbi:hypothetical protein I7412_37465 [Frankia sp. CN6]|uniref:Uncharacterized protein n=1 Tax=Frankia nepalensis TaxID=1836974 RepID=A0A937USQ5_9ACTN|nr:hypothetical protein [Frankia nepalensis]MBL7632747.1 hypothetical protein [Frankia nepalensis]
MTPASAGTADRSRGRHTARQATGSTPPRTLPPRVLLARRIVLPAATVAVAGVVTVGGAVAFASGPSAGTDRAPLAVSATLASTAPADGTVAAGPAADAADGSATDPAVDVPATAAGGAVPPTAADAAAITAAIRGSDLTRMVPPNDYRVAGIRISRGDPNWAWAELLPVTDTVDRAQGVLRRTESGWLLMQLGSAEVGCSIVPPQVRADLALDCPPIAARNG